jgi:26S proteasome regulatory subunit N5
MQAITGVVQKAMEYIDVTPDVDTRIELIKTLSSVAAGKVRRMTTSNYLLL